MRKQYDWTLPPEIEERLGESSYGRQRAMFEANHLLIVLHTPPEGEDSKRDCMVFLRTPDGKYLCNGREDGEARLRRLIRDYRALYEKCDDLYDKSNDASDLFTLMKDLLPLNRASTNFYNALQSARHFVEGDKLLIAMRDESYEVSRNFELLLGDARLTLDHQIAENAEDQADAAEATASAQHKLNILAALTFPLMGISTLMGMNLMHGLEGRPPSLHWMIVAVSGVIGLLVTVWVVKKRK